MESTLVEYSENKREKGKEKTVVTNTLLDTMETSAKGFSPLILLLKLLDRPLFLRSNVHLEQVPNLDCQNFHSNFTYTYSIFKFVVQVMCLLQVVVNNAVSEIDCEPHFGQAPGCSEREAAALTSSDSKHDNLTSEQNLGLEMNPKPSAEASSLSLKSSVNRHDIFLQLPKSDMHNLCHILAHEG